MNKDNELTDRLISPPEQYAILNGYKINEKMLEVVRKNKGYCPCSIEKTEDTKCPCKHERENRECKCGLYIKSLTK